MCWQGEAEVINLKKLLLLLILGFTVARLMIWGLIGNCTALAPDEEGYFQLFRYINNTGKTRPTVHWAGTPEWLLEIIFILAKLMNLLGLSEFQAFRLQSVILSSLAVFIIIFSLKSLGFHHRFQALNRRSKDSLLLFIVIALFMPSNIIWTFLGLREPFIHFSLALILMSFSLYFNSKTILSPWIIVYLLGLLILGNTKFYLLVVLLVSLILTFILLFRGQFKKNLPVIVIATLLCFPIFSNQFNAVNWPTLSFSTIKLSFDLLPDYEKVTLPSMTFSQIKQCQDAGTSGPLLRFAENAFEVLYYSRTQIAESQIPIDALSTLALRSDENFRSELNLSNLPVGLVSFLIFPLSILDSSLFGLLGLVESIFWLPLYVLLGIQVVRSRREIRENPLLIVSLVFLSLFTAFSALAEVNFGTALRHRSVLLAPMVLAALSTWRNKPSKGDF